MPFAVALLGGILRNALSAVSLFVAPTQSSSVTNDKVVTVLNY
jgi:hypothetical protein